MEGRKISFVVLAMAGLLTACGSRVWGDDSEISTALAFGEAEECTQNAKTREDTIAVSYTHLTLPTTPYV